MEADKTSHPLWNKFIEENYFRSVNKWYEITWEEFLKREENKEQDYNQTR